MRDRYFEDAVLERLEKIEHALAERLEKLDCLLGGLENMTAQFDQSIADLTAAVAAEQGAEDSLETLVAGFSALLATAAAGTSDATASAAILAIKATVDANAAKLVAAALANPLPGAATVPAFTVGSVTNADGSVTVTAKDGSTVTSTADGLTVLATTPAVK